MHRIRDTLTQVRSRINEASELCCRNAEEITLLAVSKKQSADRVREAWQLGLRDFGENYVSEAIDKQAQLQDCEINWHFIGPIQSNKTRAIAENFSWVHSIDRLKIAQRLNEQRPDNLPPIKICIQINIDKEESKSGIDAETLSKFVAELKPLKQLELRGLMVIPDRSNNEQKLHQTFRQTRLLLNTINQQQGMALDTLSMGMSADLKPAIAEGATIVRIGSAIFGPRT